MPIPLLFLVADTGGGHRAAARAVSEALSRCCPDQFAPVLHDPLGGPGSARLMRWWTGRYGPVTRFAPWLWGAVYHASDSRAAMWLLNSTLLAGARRSVREAVARHRPAAIVSFHPLTGAAAVAAGRGIVPVVTVVTDLGQPHRSWGYPAPDRLMLPIGGTGLPVATAFGAGPLDAAGRLGVRRALSVPDGRFLVVLTGGGEGCGRLARRAAALLRHADGVQVVVICGRNRRLRVRLDALAERSAGRLTVLGFVANMADWLRCADLVIGKAGPGTIAEASSCAAPLLLTSRLPGQEVANPGIVLRAGAGVYVPGVRALVRQVVALRDAPAKVVAMRAAAVRLGRSDAAPRIATLLVELTEKQPVAA